MLDLLKKMPTENQTVSKIFFSQEFLHSKQMSSIVANYSRFIIFFAHVYESPIIEWFHLILLTAAMMTLVKNLIKVVLPLTAVNRTVYRNNVWTTFFRNNMNA